MKWKLRPREWTPDLVAGASVALVLIPQSLAYAELAGLPPHHGLYAAAVAPIIAAFFASSPYLQTGPTAITSLLTLGALGAWAGDPGRYVVLAAILAFMVGVMRVGFGLARLGKLAFFLSPPVLKGFAVGAGLLILASQIPTVVGVAPAGDGIFAQLIDALGAPARWHWPTIAVAAATVVIVLFGRKLHRLFPGVLVASLGGLAYAMWGGYDGATIGAVPSGFVIPSVDLPWGALPDLLIPALVIALVGFAEPSAIARTYAAADRTRWDADRELIGQGAANIAAGLFAGLPVGGSFSRSAVNRLAGARTRLSGAVTGLVVLAFLPLAWVLAPLPRPVLAAIIISAVIGLLDWRGLVELWRCSWAQAVIATVTLALTLALSPRVDQAILIGIGLSLALHAWRELRVRIVITHTPQELRVAPSGVLWFASADALEQTFLDQLAEHPDAEVIALDVSGLGRIDYPGAMALVNMVQRAREGGRKVDLRNIPPHAERILGKLSAHFDHPAEAPMQESPLTLPPDPPRA